MICVVSEAALYFSVQAAFIFDSFVYSLDGIFLQMPTKELAICLKN